MAKFFWLLSLTALSSGTMVTPAFSQAPEAAADAHNAASAEAIVVTGSRISQLGIAGSANAGVVTTEQLAA